MFRLLLSLLLLLHLHLRLTSSYLNLLPHLSPSSSSSPSSWSTPTKNNIDGRFKDQNQSLTSLGDRVTTHLELARPSMFDDKVDPNTPICTLTLTLLPHHPVPYSPSSRAGCTPSSSWSRVSLRFLGSVTSHPNQPPSNDILSLWLGGAELLRTTIPESPGLTASWETLKDITRYSSLLRHPNTLVCTTSSDASASYEVKLTVTYYGIRRLDPILRANLPAIMRRYEDLNTLSVLPINLENDEKVPKDAPNTSDLSDHSENHTATINHLLDGPPADLIIPVNGENGFWNQVSGNFSVPSWDIQIPLNSWRAVLEVYVSSHGGDEFWYSIPPDSYARSMGDRDGFGGKHNKYREIFLTIDGKTVAAELPFPLIFSGGINPYFWDPVVGIAAFNVPPHDFELTPLLGVLSDGKPHLLGLGISHGNPHWLLSANLHIWLDSHSGDVEARNIMHHYAPLRFSQESSFNESGDGWFKSKAKRKVTSSGWVMSPVEGNVTMQITQELEFKNHVGANRENGCLIVRIDQETESEREVTVKSSQTGEVILKMSIERKYPLSLNIRSCHATECESRYTTSLNVSLKEEEYRNGELHRSYTNRRSSKGWMQVKDHKVITNGAAQTRQSMSYRDENGGCYTRTIEARDRRITGDNTDTRCQVVSVM